MTPKRLRLPGHADAGEHIALAVSFAIVVALVVWWAGWPAVLGALILAYEWLNGLPWWVGMAAGAICGFLVLAHAIIKRLDAHTHLLIEILRRLEKPAPRGDLW